MAELLIGSVCSGYEGLGMGVMSVLGGTLAWVADNAPVPAAILAHRFPGVPNLGDITAVNWATVEPVDVLVAGFPCQDVSSAGRRAGLRHGNRSGMWHAVAGAIAELRPALVVIENVQGLLTSRGDEPSDDHLKAEAARDAAARLAEWVENERRIAAAKGDGGRVQRCASRIVRVLGYHRRAVARCQWHERRLVRAIGTVLGSLASLGFDAEWVRVAASDAGACHGRKRVFILAWLAADTGGKRRNGWLSAVREQKDGSGAPVQDPDRPVGGERGLAAPGQAPGGGPRAYTGGPGGAPAANADGGGCEIGAELDREPQPAAAHGDSPRQHPDGCGVAVADTPDGGQPQFAGGIDGRELVPAWADPARVCERPGIGAGFGDCPGGDTTRTAAHVAERGAWGRYAPAIIRWETIIGRPAPPATNPGRTGERLSPAFVEWMMGLPEGWVTGVPGLSVNDQLAALGNGCVPQQVALALRILLSYAGGRARAGGTVLAERRT